MALISECELDPADQERQCERFVRMLDVVPAGGKAVREPWGRDLGGLPAPVAAVGLHQQHRCQFAFCDSLAVTPSRSGLSTGKPTARRAQLFGGNSVGPYARKGSGWSSERGWN